MSALIRNVVLENGTVVRSVPVGNYLAKSCVSFACLFVLVTDYGDSPIDQNICKLVKVSEGANQISVAQTV